MARGSDGLPTYKRLGGRGRRAGGLGSLFSRCSLYLGDDHILSVESTGYTERYKRFYFPDIAAIITRKTKRWIVLNIILSIATLLWAALTIAVDNGSGRIILAFFGLIFLLGFVYNLLKGPTCRSSIVTAVQEEPLPSLDRVRSANKVIAILKRSVEAVQGALDQETLAGSALGASFSDSAVQRPAMTGARQARSTTQIRHDEGTLHLIAFWLFMGAGVLGVMGFVHHTRPMAMVSSLFTVAYSILAVVAAVRQQGTDIPAMVRKLTWGSIVFTWLSLFMGSIFSTVMSLQGSRMAHGRLDVYSYMLDLSPQDSTAFMIVSAIEAVCCFAIAVPGVIGVMRHRRETPPSEDKTVGEGNAPR